LFEVVDGRTNSGDANPIDLGKTFLKILPNIETILMKHQSLSNLFGYRVDYPGMNEVIASFPS
jgi:hypothetical protein